MPSLLCGSEVWVYSSIDRHCIWYFDFLIPGVHYCSETRELWILWINRDLIKLTRSIRFQFWVPSQPAEHEWHLREPRLQRRRQHQHGVDARTQEKCERVMSRDKPLSGFLRDFSKDYTPIVKHRSLIYWELKVQMTLSKFGTGIKIRTLQ